MRFGVVPAALVLTFSTFAISAPVPLAERGLAMQRRAVAITYNFSPTGDFKPIPPVTPLPTAPPPSNSQKSKFNRQQKQFDGKTTARNALLGQVQPRIQAVLDAAQASLGLPAALTVIMKSTFHESDDPETHATFRFTTPNGVCAATCVGHAYNPVALATPGKGQVGKIFDNAHNVVFGNDDI